MAGALGKSFSRIWANHIPSSSLSWVPRSNTEGIVVRQVQEPQGLPMSGLDVSDPQSCTPSPRPSFLQYSSFSRVCLCPE